MNKKCSNTFEDNSQIHVKSVLTMFWRKKCPQIHGFATCVYKTVDKNAFIV